MGNLQPIRPNLNINLIETAQAEYDFLRLVDKYPALYCENVLKNAVYRYENYWLPLLAKYDLVLIAPLDIEWVWHSHVLSRSYSSDCKQHVGKVIDHVPMFLALKTLSISQKYWSTEYPNVDYQVDLSDINPLVISTKPSKFSYDIIKDTHSHRIFSYNVSLPHFRDYKFLKKAADRYIMRLYMTLQAVITESQLLLYIKGENHKCFGSDLVLHGHQQHVLKYNADLLHIFKIKKKYIDRNYGMYDIWKRNSLLYSINGSDLRGEPPMPNLNVDKYYFCRSILKHWGSTFNFKSISIIGSSLNFHDVINPDVVVKITVKCITGEIAKFCKKYTTVNGTFQAKLTAGEASFQIDSRIIYKANIVCLFPLLLKEFYGTINLSLCDSMQYMEYLKCSSDDKSIICKISSSLSSFERFNYTKFDTSGDYRVFDSNLKNAINGFLELFPSLKYDAYASCQYSENYLKANDSSVLLWKVIHSKDPQISVIEICDNFDNIIATSHSIDSWFIPDDTQVSHSGLWYDRGTNFILYPRFERAMLIRGIRGDWGLIKARWKGFKYSELDNCGKHGKLDVELFILNGKKSTFVNVDSCHLGTTFIINKSITVNLKSGFISLSKDLKDIPQCLCVGLSIAVLFVLCQPRPMPNYSAGLGWVAMMDGYYGYSSTLELDSMDILKGAGLYFKSLPRLYHLLCEKYFIQSIEETTRDKMRKEVFGTSNCCA